MIRTIGSGGIYFLVEGIEAEGWNPAEHAQSPATIDGSFAWTLLATHQGGSRLILCEAGVRREFPDYSERRAWLREVGAKPRDLLLITDAAHREFVLAGFIEVADRMIYAEDWLEEGRDSLVEPLRRFQERPSATHSGEREILDAEMAIGTAIWSRLPARSKPRDVTEPDLTAWVASSDDPAAVRAFWRTLRKVTIVDHDCRSAGWLLAAAHLLEACYLATLSRLESFLIDEISRMRSIEAGDGERKGSSAGGKDRRRRWHDLRKSLFGQRWDGFRRPDRAELRGDIVRRQIVGFARSARDAAACRRMLLSYVGDPRPRFPSLDTNVWKFCGKSEQHLDEADTGALPSDPAIRNRADARFSDTAISRFAGGWRLIADARTQDGWTVDEWRRACRDLHRARVRIGRLPASGRAITDPGGLDPRLLAPGLQPENVLIVRRT